MKVAVGDQAPDFAVTGHDGQEVRLSDYRGKKVVVLFFYPKDGTPICTQEACAFRDAYEDFVEAGAVVIGVSAIRKTGTAASPPAIGYPTSW